MTQVYIEQPGADNDDTREYLRLAFEAHTMHSLPAARRLRTFWSEHVSTSDGTQFTVTHVEPSETPICAICHTTEATVYARPNAEPTLCYYCAFTAREAVADDTPDDAPGEDCPEHGPYGDDDCPKCSTYINPRWSKEGDLPCENPAIWTIDGVPFCGICAHMLQGEHLYAVLVPIATARDNIGLIHRPVEPRAATLQSIEIERRLFVCKNCQGIHPTQRCPELRAALLADEPAIAVYETHEMVRLWGASRTLLVAKLARLTRPQLVCQAVAFAAWLDERTQAGLSAASVLHIWETMLDDGPAAPAMQVAA